VYAIDGQCGGELGCFGLIFGLFPLFLRKMVATAVTASGTAITIVIITSTGTLVGVGSGIEYSPALVALNF
jgi:hypothetical protein